MTLRPTARLLAAGLVASLLGGGISFAGTNDYCHLSEAPLSSQLAERPQAPEIHEQLKPLADLLATGEGHYNSVNRGWAGDTPGGARSVFGRDLTTFTVGEIISLQRRGRIFAVGRYQFIPVTLRYAVNSSAVNTTQLFSEEVQDRLMAALIVYKRPMIITYLQGNHDNLSRVLDDLAREWASVEYRYGRSYYSRGGNRAKISRAQAAEVLKSIKAGWQHGAVLP